MRPIEKDKFIQYKNTKLPIVSSHYNRIKRTLQILTPMNVHKLIKPKENSLPNVEESFFGMNGSIHLLSTTMFSLVLSSTIDHKKMLELRFTWKITFFLRTISLLLRYCFLTVGIGQSQIRCLCSSNFSKTTKNDRSECVV